MQYTANPQMSPEVYMEVSEGQGLVCETSEIGRMEYHKQSWLDMYKEWLSSTASLHSQDSTYFVLWEMLNALSLCTEIDRVVGGINFDLMNPTKAPVQLPTGSVQFYVRMLAMCCKQVSLWYTATSLFKQVPKEQGMLCLQAMSRIASALNPLVSSSIMLMIEQYKCVCTFH